jgi:hypothetical protein
MRWIAIAVAVVGLALAALVAVLPVSVSVPGHRAFECGRPVRRVISSSELHRNWKHGSVSLTRAGVPANKLPSRTCASAEDTRLVIGGALGVVGVIGIAGAFVAARREDDNY